MTDRESGFSAQTLEEQRARVSDNNILIWNDRFPYILKGQVNHSGVFSGVVYPAQFHCYSVCIFGEWLIEVTTLSRGAMRKRPECAFRERQQQSPLYVKDWLKRREILSLLQEAAKQ